MWADNRMLRVTIPVQIWAAVIGASGTISGALIVSTGVRDALAGVEEIRVEVRDRDARPNTGAKLVLAHNYGGQSGTLLPNITIVASGERDELGRLPASLNSGVAGGTSQSPFTLAAGEGKRFFLDLPSLPAGAESCVMQFDVMQLDGNRLGQSPPFECGS